MTMRKYASLWRLEWVSAMAAMVFSVHGARAQAPKSLMDQVLDRKELRVGVELKYPPIMYRDPSGNPVGFEVDLAKTMCDTLKVKCTFVDVEFPALIPALEAGKIDIIVAQMALTPARAIVVDFCKPFEATGDVVIVPPNSSLPETATADQVIAALNKPDVKIATQLSTVELQIRSSVFPNSQPVDVNGPLDAFLQVATGRAGATLSDDVSALTYAKEHPELDQGYSLMAGINPISAIFLQVAAFCAVTASSAAGLTCRCRTGSTPASIGGPT